MTARENWQVFLTQSCCTALVTSFGSDAMDGTGNVYAVADAMGHSRINDIARRYQHPVLEKVTEAIERRNQQRVQ